ncbi:hypothetical protein CTA1_4275 [Colletotrichum tanaceti]|uniref:Uncharacterized protein n=1 Tax=Colletotrichum tanaceti TaxID=1306861 RepID=A0A4U6XIL2_9PEZI|nr:hypothetical protein CTA1_4275 [Colletotrichum tanaceti]
MQLLTAILAFAAVAAAAPSALANPENLSYEAPDPCAPDRVKYWNTENTGGGWACTKNASGGCFSYYWTTVPPYWSCDTPQIPGLA